MLWTVALYREYLNCTCGGTKCSGARCVCSMPTSRRGRRRAPDDCAGPAEAPLDDARGGAAVSRRDAADPALRFRPCRLLFEYRRAGCCPPTMCASLTHVAHYYSCDVLMAVPFVNLNRMVYLQAQTLQCSQRQMTASGLHSGRRRLQTRRCTTISSMALPVSSGAGGSQASNGRSGRRYRL